MPVYVQVRVSGYQRIWIRQVIWKFTFWIILKYNSPGVPVGPRRPVAVVGVGPLRRAGVGVPVEEEDALHAPAEVAVVVQSGSGGIWVHRVVWVVGPEHSSGVVLKKTGR